MAQPEATERTEERQTLRGLATWLVSMDDPCSSARQSVTLTEIIKQAKLALENEEERTEYRVAGNTWAASVPTCSIEVAENDLALLRSAGNEVRIQTRTENGPWVDLDEGEGGDG